MKRAINQSAVIVIVMYFLAFWGPSLLSFFSCGDFGCGFTTNKPKPPIAQIITDFQKQSTMRNIIILTLSTLAFLFYNIEFQYSGGNSGIMLSGPVGGILILGIIVAILLYRTFLSFQDYLVTLGLLSERVKTAFDKLPLIVIIPLGVCYTWRTDAFVFKWGISDLKIWYFVALLAAIFAFQFYLVVRDVAATSTASNGKSKK